MFFETTHAFRRRFRRHAGIAAMAIIATLAASSSALADTIRTYQFNGTLAAGTIDTLGAFGPVGGNLGGDNFSAAVAIDLTTSNVSFGDNGDRTRTAPILGQSLTINGIAFNAGSGATLTAHQVADTSFEFYGGAYSYYVQLAGSTAFPDYDFPGTYDVGCTNLCDPIITYQFSGKVAGLSLGSTLKNYVVSDGPAPVPLPPSVTLLLSTLVLGSLTMRRRIAPEHAPIRLR